MHVSRHAVWLAQHFLLGFHFYASPPRVDKCYVIYQWSFVSILRLPRCITCIFPFKCCLCVHFRLTWTYLQHNEHHSLTLCSPAWPNLQMLIHAHTYFQGMLPHCYCLVVRISLQFHKEIIYHCIYIFSSCSVKAGNTCTCIMRWDVFTINVLQSDNLYVTFIW